MKNPAILPIILLLTTITAAQGAAPAPGMRQPTQAEKDFYASTVLPAMTTVRKAMPRAPQGWSVHSETPVALALPEQVTDDAGRLRFAYEISYRRIDGMADEVKRLDEVYAEAKKKHGEAAKAQSGELAKKQAEAEKALTKAVKNKKKADEKRLRKELEEIKAKQRAVPEDMEQAILAETNDYLIRDTAMTVRVAVNETAAGMPQARAFSRPKAAYALKKQGGRVGPTGWQTDQLMILYGDWDDAGNDQFRGRVDGTPFSPKVRTIAVTFTGDRSRTEQFLKQMGMKDILGLMQ